MRIIVSDSSCLIDLSVFLQTGIDVHGFLWVVDELYRCEISAANALCSALRLLADDPAVRLPRWELALYIRR